MFVRFQRKVLAWSNAGLGPPGFLMVTSIMRVCSSSPISLQPFCWVCWDFSPLERATWDESLCPPAPWDRKAGVAAVGSQEVGAEVELFWNKCFGMLRPLASLKHHFFFLFFLIYTFSSLNTLKELFVHSLNLCTHIHKFSLGGGRGKRITVLPIVGVLGSRQLWQTAAFLLP